MVWEFSHYGSESSVAWKTASREYVIIKGPPTAPDIFHVLAAQEEQNVKYTVGQKDGGGVLLGKYRTENTLWDTHKKSRWCTILTSTCKS